MVIELKVPRGDSLGALTGLVPVFISYVLSFVYVTINLNNHHHMIYTCRSITGATLWANTHLLFCLSLILLTTRMESLEYWGRGQITPL